jgi:alkylation response protein AidB-like acyl-CoA dehydrogenase
MAEEIGGVAVKVGEVAARWRSERSERQRRRHLERHDFALLRKAGLLDLVVPVEQGGFWRGLPASVRPVCETYRLLAMADPSVALVSSMHAAVVGYWLTNPDPSQPDWEAQRRAVFASAAAGDQWGTITSEPGSGGDIARTRASATPAAPSTAPDAKPFLTGASYAVTGDKHFGSGFGVTDRMMTTAIPAGESDPTIFVLDVRDRPWDGTAGLELIAEWDGLGMAATQSHAMRLQETPAVRLAWDGPLDTITRGAGPFVASLFTAVVLGVLDEAVATARDQVRSKADQLRAYERVEWARAEQDHWVAQQAFDGALRAVESGESGEGPGSSDNGAALHATLRAKQAVADLAEQTLLRISRVLGGGTFSQRSPFAHWFEDVRALGFLRPPWGLAYDGLFATSIE